VIGGDYRGRRLAAPVGGTVRPTSDRVREAVFDMLFSLGGVDGLQVVDLFAGTGALGIEALSRGAASATFVDRDPASLDAVRRNLEAIGLEQAVPSGEATLVRGDVEGWVTTTASRFDVVFCDPPYDYEGWEVLLTRLPGDLGVLESGRTLPEVAGCRVLKIKRYGGTIVTVVVPERPDVGNDDSDGRSPDCHGESPVPPPAQTPPPAESPTLAQTPPPAQSPTLAQKGPS